MMHDMCERMDQPRHPTGVRRAVPPSPADQVDMFAQKGVTADFETLMPDIERAVKAILRAQRYVCWWHVRLALYDAGKIDGTEVMRAAGTFARRCGLLACRDEEGGVKSERPDARYNKLFPDSHGNRHTRYRYPLTLTERSAAVERASR